MIGVILWPLIGLCTTIGLILAAFHFVSAWQDRDPSARLVHRHALPRRDRGERDFWADVETGTEGQLGIDESEPLEPLPPGFELGSLYVYRDPANLPAVTQGLPTAPGTGPGNRTGHGGELHQDVIPARIQAALTRQTPGSTDTIIDRDHTTLTRWLEAVMGGDPWDGLGDASAWLERKFYGMAVTS